MEQDFSPTGEAFVSLILWLIKCKKYGIELSHEGVIAKAKECIIDEMSVESKERYLNPHIESLKYIKSRRLANK